MSLSDPPSSNIHWALSRGRAPLDIKDTDKLGTASVLTPTRGTEDDQTPNAEFPGTGLTSSEQATRPAQATLGRHRSGVEGTSSIPWLQVQGRSLLEEGKLGILLRMRTPE